MIELNNHRYAHIEGATMEKHVDSWLEEGLPPEYISVYSTSPTFSLTPLQASSYTSYPPKCGCTGEVDESTLESVSAHS